MKTPIFSIITTTYNRVESGYLEQNISSLQDQEHADGITYEHIIVDDGSSDNTKDIVESFAKNDNRIRYIYQKNLGPAKATQNGIKNAKGEFVIIADDDDLLTLDSLSKRVEFIQKNPRVDFFYGLAEWVDEYSLPIAPLLQSSAYDERLYEKMLIGNCINAGTPTIRRSELVKIKWPEWVDRSQDYFLWLELLRPEKKLKIAHIPEVIFKYRYHAGSYTSAINDIDKLEKKRNINSRIKSLHKAELVYLAEEADRWAYEARQLNTHRLGEIKAKNARIDELQTALDYYAMSRVVKYAVKLRNVIRAQTFDRLGRAKNRSARLIQDIKMKNKQLPYRIVDNSVWDSRDPIITIVTPFYNREDTMPETIRSVLGQTYQDFEYIIVNDGSTNPDARAYLEKISHPKIKIINQKNKGVAVARNTGIAHAKGKYIICLDSDDIIDPTYVEKSVIVLETNHNVSLVTYDMQMFGVKDEPFHYQNYNPYVLIDDNPILTSAAFRKELWIATGGYKPGIGYEDWEFWVNAAEQGFFGLHIPEKLFDYRTAEASRYIDDLTNHRQHTAYIKGMHPDFKQRIRKVENDRAYIDVINTETAFVNLDRPSQYNLTLKKQQVLVVIPWMTFGGAETLIYNYCKEVKDQVDLIFVTGLKSPNEWQYKFQELSTRIYHLANLFDNEKLYLEYISNLIKTRNIDVIHIVHSGYAFSMLEELKRRHQSIKVIVTLFNDRAAYFEQAVQVAEFIDSFTADNNAVVEHFQKRLPLHNDVRVIPNGVDAQKVYNPDLYNRAEIRRDLGVKDDEYAVFFIGRLSEEKNPNVFIDSAKRIIQSYENFKFFIIGDGNMRNEIEDSIGRTATDKIIYLGYKPAVASFLSAADIFVLPSSIEGFPLSILEAMAMNVIPVASDVGAVSDVIDNGVNGFVIQPGSVDDIVSVIEDVVVDRDKYNSIRKAARQKVINQYSTVQLGENYRKLYRGEK